MTGEELLSKTNRVNMLFDFYGPLLTDKQRTFLGLYFHDDYSLGEIAAEFDISRQAVYEHIKRAESMLEDYEAKLRLLEKHEQKRRIAEQIEAQLERAAMPEREQLKELVKKLYHIE